MDTILKNILRQITQFITQNKKNNTQTIAVFAPYFENANEGYLQRVRAIDTEVLCDFACIHFDFETKCETAFVQKKSDRHLLVGLPPHDSKAIKIAIKAARLCRVMYIHSVMRAMQNVTGEGVSKLFSVKGVYKIWDVHGAVPEEYVMQENFYEAQNATQAEQLLLKNADTIVVISDAMKNHFEKKYNITLNNTINTSVFNITNVEIENIIKLKPTQKYTAAYAGNVMAWQNVDLMQQVICECGEKYDYKIFVSQPDRFYELAQDISLPKTCFVTTSSPTEVLKQYEQCHFGFVLRDDTAVNNVACPTKLMEYIQLGLIPVLKTENIGDFVSLGLKYVDYKNLKALDLTFEEYSKMAIHNNGILLLLQNVHNNGVKMLKQVISQQLGGK